jgi:serine phosphatase RsbU (regulator of sigma subunit)
MAGAAVTETGEQGSRAASARAPEERPSPAGPGLADPEATASFERWRRERLEFLVEVNDVVADCADRRAVMRAVANAAVPRLGDWCVIYVLLDPADRVPAVEVGHWDTAVAARARQLVERFPPGPGSPWGVLNVMSTGEPEFHADITDEVLASLSKAAATAARDMDFRSSIAVPLVKRRAVVGALQFLLSGPDRHYNLDDLTLAQALAGRVASALDNRRLAEAHRDVAQTLQRSLLPGTLPEIPGAEVAVRYWATGEATEIGGDFYDVFAVDDATYAVVVGDVCGKGPAAAAVTALARHTVRASAWRGDDHLSVLARLNTALLRSEPGTLCTVAYATVTPMATGLRVVVAAAGHPLPVIVGAQGTAVALGEHGVLLGAFDEVVATTADYVLAPGDTVVLYTDGANDLRPPDTLSPEDMCALVARAVAGAPSADDAAARIFGALGDLKAFDERDDDIALVVLRARPR